jgi:hypothetical protein
MPCLAVVGPLRVFSEQVLQYCKESFNEQALQYDKEFGDLRERVKVEDGAECVSCSDGAFPLGGADEVESHRSTGSGSEDVHSGPEDYESRGGTRPVSGNALFVFDWDNTLFPTSWLQWGGVHQGDSSDARRQKAQFRKVARSVCALLEVAKRLGKVVVVTNAEAGWIEHSCTLFLPELAPVLEGLHLVSARSTFLGSAEAEPSEWKCQAFDREIQAFCAGRACAGNLQVFSLGDSLYEHAALFKVARAMPIFTPKSVKLMEHPTAAQLVEEQELLAGSLEDLFEQEGEIDIEVGAEAIA